MADTNASSEQMFSDFIRTLGRGALDEEATAEIKKLVRELTAFGNGNGGKPKGKISLTVEFVYDKGIVDVTSKMNVTRPSPVRAREIRYATDDGRLTREDERQGKLFDARELGTGEIKNTL